jgi:NADPH:quinone reductase-like Zn-dependent oxidoreductase
VKAIVQYTYGSPDALALGDVEPPLAKGREVLVRVRAASVNPEDWHHMRGLPLLFRTVMGLRAPSRTVPGGDMAGTVEAVGQDVTRFKLGDEVFASIEGGSLAEYACAPEGLLAPKPANLTFEEAAAVPMAGLTALQGLRDQGRIQPGQKVLIIGASGGVGTFAVQIAKAFGAHVTGVCSTRNLGLVRSLGADQTIDYTREEVIRHGRKYDLVFQVAGTRSPSDLRRALTPTGTLVLCSGDSDGRWIGAMSRFIKASALSPFVPQRLGSVSVKRAGDDLHALKTLIESGKVSPVIDRAYQLAESPEAIRYLEEGHARGKVVISI